VECPAGKTSTGSHDASGGNTACEATLCSVNERVSGNECVACTVGKANPAGNDASGSDTTCQFDLGLRVQLRPGSRYDHETCQCADLTVEQTEELIDTIGTTHKYVLIGPFGDGRKYQYQYEDLETCTEASAYIAVTSGSCSGITSLALCSNAACKLGFADFTAVSDNRNGASNYPPYCYIDPLAPPSYLKFNDGTNTGTCSDDHKCACKAQ